LTQVANKVLGVVDFTNMLKFDELFTVNSLTD
jgi:hypothetical protein